MDAGSNSAGRFCFENCGKGFNRSRALISSPVFESRRSEFLLQEMVGKVSQVYIVHLLCSQSFCLCNTSPGAGLRGGDRSRFIVVAHKTQSLFLCHCLLMIVLFSMQTVVETLYLL